MVINVVPGLLAGVQTEGYSKFHTGAQHGKIFGNKIHGVNVLTGYFHNTDKDNNPILDAGGTNPVEDQIGFGVCVKPPANAKNDYHYVPGIIEDTTNGKFYAKAISAFYFDLGDKILADGNSHIREGRNFGALVVGHIYCRAKTEIIKGQKCFAHLITGEIQGDNLDELGAVDANFVEVENLICSKGYNPVNKRDGNGTGTVEIVRTLFKEI